MSTDLLPCPFCGVDPVSRRSAGDTWEITCDEGECGWACVYAFTEEDAIAQWQTRRFPATPAPESPAPALDALEKEIVSAACLAYSVRRNGDKAPMIALDDAVRAYMAAPSPVPAAPAGGFDFRLHLQRQADFSLRTFGPGARVKGVTDHIRKELAEVEASGGSLAEWIDVVILGLDGCWRSGASPLEIIHALDAKQIRNENRAWPDWRTADPDKAIEHDRSGEGSASSSPQRAASGQIREAAQALAAKLHEIHAHPAYQAVWSCHHIHWGQYNGPQYEAELKALDAALLGEAPPKAETSPNLDLYREENRHLTDTKLSPGATVQPQARPMKLHVTLDIRGKYKPFALLEVREKEIGGFAQTMPIPVAQEIAYRINSFEVRTEGGVE